MRQHLFRKPAARHDLTVAFDGDAFAVQRKVIDQLRYIDRRLELLRLSINSELYHGKSSED